VVRGRLEPRSVDVVGRRAMTWRFYVPIAFAFLLVVGVFAYCLVMNQ
jgi:hypothetical protein